MGSKTGLIASLTKKFKKATKLKDETPQQAGAPAPAPPDVPQLSQENEVQQLESASASSQSVIKDDSAALVSLSAVEHSEAGPSTSAGHAQKGDGNGRNSNSSLCMMKELSPEEQAELLKPERDKVAAFITHAASIDNFFLQTSLNAGGLSDKLVVNDKARSVDADVVWQLKNHMNDKTTTIAVAKHCPAQLLTETWVVEDFSLRRKVYEGGASVVCEARHRESGYQVALKIYKRSRLHEMERFQLAREICLHIRVLHPHIVSLYMAWKDNKYVYLCMEWAPRGNLLDYLVSLGGKMPEKKAVEMVVKPMLSALEHLHSQRLIHRDIKLENIIVDSDGKAKLADFGLSIDQKFEQANTRLGTFGYFAPEILDCPLKRSPFDYKNADIPSYDCKVDVWSMGVVTYEILTGSAPFTASTSQKILLAIRNREIKLPDHLSPEAKNYLECVLVRDPKQRWSAAQLLEHPWIQMHSSEVFSS